MEASWSVICILDLHTDDYANANSWWSWSSEEGHVPFMQKELRVIWSDQKDSVEDHVLMTFFNDILTVKIINIL